MHMTSNGSDRESGESFPLSPDVCCFRKRMQMRECFGPSFRVSGWICRLSTDEVADVSSKGKKRSKDQENEAAADPPDVVVVADCPLCMSVFLSLSFLSFLFFLFFEFVWPNSCVCLVVPDRHSEQDSLSGICNGMMRASYEQHTMFDRRTHYHHQSKGGTSSLATSLMMKEVRVFSVSGERSVNTSLTLTGKEEAGILYVP